MTTGRGRATVTVLFTDLVGSTELRSRLGEQAADDLRRTHDRLLSGAVEENGGRVVKGLVDGIMAAFSGASDAAAAAVAMQQTIHRLNHAGKAVVPLSVRIGLSAGDVTLEDEDVHGTPVIEASRLCAAAGGGEILVADVVRLLAGLGDDDVADRGQMELKGLPKPVSAWEVRWEPAPVSMLPLPSLLTDLGLPPGWREPAWSGGGCCRAAAHPAMKSGPGSSSARQRRPPESSAWPRFSGTPPPSSRGTRAQGG